MLVKLGLLKEKKKKIMVLVENHFNPFSILKLFLSLMQFNNLINIVMFHCTGTASSGMHFLLGMYSFR